MLNSAASCGYEQQ